MAEDGISPVRVGFAIAGVAMTVFTILHGTGALAQSTPLVPQEANIAPPATGALGAASITRFDRKTLDAFARATRIVGALRNEYTPRIAAANIAGRPEKAAALFDEMRARMHDAIDATGLTIERYEAIAARAEHDNALRARIEAILTGAEPAPEPGLGVQAPTNSPPVTDEPDENEAALAAARAEIDELHRRLDAERSRARAERDRATRDAAALQASLEGAIERLTVQLDALSREDAAREKVLDEAMARERAAAEAVRVQAQVTVARAELEQAALQREIDRLSRDMAGAVAALAALEADLSMEPANATAQPLTRLEPVDRPTLLAGKLPTLARDLTAVQSRDALMARLESEKTRNLTLRADHAAERVGLRREIARIGQDLAATRDMLSNLAGDAVLASPEAPDAEDVAERAVARVRAQSAPVEEPASDPMHDAEVYAVVTAERPEKPVEMPPVVAMEVVTARTMVPGTVAPLVAPPVEETLAVRPDMPATVTAPEITPSSVPPAPVIRSGTVLAGIRAYELKEYGRAYEIWRPLAEAGRANAQFHLGALYFEGRGTPRDLREARRWLRLALGQGQERARFLLGRVEEQIAKSNG